MDALSVAEQLGVPPGAAQEYLTTCNDVVESNAYVATLRGNTVHIAVKLDGLGGRKLLKDCRGTLSRWFADKPILFAPVKHGNLRAVRLAQALGFRIYEATSTHVWLVQEKGHFDGHA